MWGKVDDSAIAALPIAVKKLLNVTAVDVAWSDTNFYDVVFRWDKSTTSKLVFQVSGNNIGGFTYIALCIA